ncbi:MAG: extracellular solute-binding protein [Firmicutes bacterium]|nr:extracellular solute-binding protein [Bacillota bacterium]
MKRLLSIGLVICLIVSIFGCTPGKQNSGSGGNSSSQTSKAEESSKQEASKQEESKQETSTAPVDEKFTMRFSWWGNDTRNEMTAKIIDMYTTENPNITIEPEFLAFSAYWEKLATQAAGGTLADVMQFNETRTQEYARKNLLYPLNSFVESGALYVDPSAMGTFGDYTYEGKYYGINAGSNALGIHYDVATLKEAGVTVDDTKWTYEDYEQLVRDVYAKTGKKADLITQGGTILSSYYRNFGTQTYADDLKSYIMTAEQLQPLLEVDYRLYQDGLTPTYDNYVGEVWGDDVFSKGETWLRVHWSNELDAANNYAGREISIFACPIASNGTQNPFWIRGSMNWSVNAATTNPDECIKFVNWVVNSEECNKVLGSERGVSINPQIREMLSQNATPILQDVFNFVDKVSKLQTVAYKSQAPVGTNEVSTLITDSLAEMFYGMATPEETAKKIVEEANKILANNN